MIQAVWQLLVSFGQIGLFALGGGHSMLKLIEEECVENRGWLSLDEFSTLVGVSFLFPGLTAVKLSALIGLRVAGAPGLIAAVLGINLPGLGLALVFYTFIIDRQDVPVVRKLVVGMQYGAVALLGAALYALTKPLWGENFTWTASLLAAGLFVAVAFLDISPFASIVVFVIACVILL